MTGPAPDREVEYYRRLADEVAAENIRLDVAAAALQHELKQKRQGFALLSELYRKVTAAHLQPSTIFEIVVPAINSTLGMDRTVLLAPTAVPPVYRPERWLGFHDEAAVRLRSVTIEIPADLIAGGSPLLVNKATPATPFIENIRTAFGLPYFVCLPVLAHGAPIGILLSGRLKEARPLLPPLDQGDIDTFEAIAGLISAAVELERVERLRSFLPPQLAQVIVDSGSESLLEHHRREIASVFCDLRGFTTFSENFEPEVVLGVLQGFLEAMGELIFRYDGTLEHIAGDGLMVFFNDPLPCLEPAQRAVQMALAMRDRVGELAEAWRKSDYDLGFGVGISVGFATLGKVGFERRFHYAAIGSVVNLASRLCDEARAGQILVTSRVQAAVEQLVETEPVGQLTLKGFNRPIAAFNVLGYRGADAKPGRRSSRRAQTTRARARGAASR